MTIFMYIFYRGVFIGIIASLGLCSWVFFAEAGTYQTTLAECQKRTGLGEGLCKTLIKNNLNVESCKKQTGLSDDECAKRIEEIRNDPDFSGKTAETVRPVNTEEQISSPVAQPVSFGESTIAELRIKKERQLAELQLRTKALIKLLKEKGIDVSAVEKNLGELETKSAEFLAAYDAFRTTYVDTKNDPAYRRKAIREEARGIVNRSRSTLTDYYRMRILDPLRTAYKQSL